MGTQQTAIDQNFTFRKKSKSLKSPHNLSSKSRRKSSFCKSPRTAKKFKGALSNKNNSDFEGFENEENKKWINQRIKRMKKMIKPNILKEFGINFEQSNDWKDVMNASFNIIQKFASFIISKEEQYVSVSNKWMLSKRDNKQLKKNQNMMEAQIEKQKNIINDLKQTICEKDKRTNVSKANLRESNDKIRELESQMIQIQNEYDQQIEDMQQENTALGVKLKNALHEMEETKADCDELSEDNLKLKNNVYRLQNVIKITNQKSMELIQCIQNSKDIASELSIEDSADIDNNYV